MSMRMRQEDEAIAWSQPARPAQDRGDEAMREAAAARLRAAADARALLAMQQLGEGPTREGDLVQAYGAEILGTLDALLAAGLAHADGPGESRTWALSPGGRQTWMGLRLVLA
jgi:hypothetical protein